MIEKATKTHQEILEKEYSQQMSNVHKMQQELDEKLKEVTKKVNNKKADEYNQKIKLLEQEQLILTQAFYRMGLKLYQQSSETQPSNIANKENDTIEIVNRIKNKTMNQEETRRSATVKPSLKEKALATRSTDVKK